MAGSRKHPIALMINLTNHDGCSARLQGCAEQTIRGKHSLARQQSWSSSTLDSCGELLPAPIIRIVRFILRYHVLPSIVLPNLLYSLYCAAQLSLAQTFVPLRACRTRHKPFPTSAANAIFPFRWRYALLPMSTDNINYDRNYSCGHGLRIAHLGGASNSCKHSLAR
jgi:hypothetical protein